LTRLSALAERSAVHGYPVSVLRELVTSY